LIVKVRFDFQLHHPTKSPFVILEKAIALSSPSGVDDFDKKEFLLLRG